LFANTRDYICHLYGIPEGTFYTYAQLFNKIAVLEKKRILTGNNIFITKDAYLNGDITAVQIDVEYKGKVTQSVIADKTPTEVSADAKPNEQLKQAAENIGIAWMKAGQELEDNYIAAKREETTSLAEIDPMSELLTAEEKDLLDNPYGINGLTKPKQEEIKNKVAKAVIEANPETKENLQAEYDKVFQRLRGLEMEREELLAPIKAQLDYNQQERWSCKFRLEELKKLLKLVGGA